MSRIQRSLIVIVFLVLLAIGIPLFGQQQTIITVAAPLFYEDAMREAIADFEAQYPDAKVIYRSGNPNWPDAADDIEGHLEDIRNYAASADVLLVEDGDLSPAATAAGYMLNLRPLTDNDPSLDVNDFYPGFWESFQWDRGLWALPVFGLPQAIIYDRTAFDRVGLRYPDEFWTLDDVETAADLLAQRDANGDIIVPGAQIDNVELIFRALLGRGFYDPNELPNLPRFTDPDMIDLAEAWYELQQTGLLGPFIGLDFEDEEVPVRLTSVVALAEGGFFGGGSSDAELAGALLPGGTAGVEVTGFAISAGTSEPDLAYEFVRFLTYQPGIANLIFTNNPARRSLAGGENDGGLFSGFQLEYSPENQDFVDLALERAIPASELRYTDYLNNTVTRVIAGEVNVSDGLREAELRALDELRSAQDRPTAEDALLVATPIPTPVLASGEISLRFGLNLLSAEIPNEQEWNRLVLDFVAVHPRVGNIELIPPSFGIGLGDDASTEYDCYYEPFNSVPSADIATLLSFDPFIDTDPGFDRNDFIGTSLQQVSRENRVWAYPMVIQPEILWYNADAFAIAGLPAPEGGWSVEAFTEALDFLTFVTEDPDAPTFRPQTFDNTYLLMLIAAYGGVPYDYRSNPPTVAFTDPTNLEAITQVLNLAKDGYLDYQALSPDGAGPPGDGGENEGLAPIFTDTLNTFNFRLSQRSEDPELAPYRLTTYPRGDQFVPVSYTIGTAYISAQSRDPEACYAWIRSIATRPDLLSGLPARMSQINDPALVAAQGEDIVTLYEDYVAQLELPNTIVFPSFFADGNIAIGPLLEGIWVNRAFDAYVFDDADLFTGLADAEFYIAEYRTCVEDIPPFDIRQAQNFFQVISSVRDYAECAVQVDPTLEPLFGPLLG